MGDRSSGQEVPEMAFRLLLPNQVFGFVFGINKHGMEAAGISLLFDHRVRIVLIRDGQGSSFRAVTN